MGMEKTCYPSNYNNISLQNKLIDKKYALIKFEKEFRTSNPSVAGSNPVGGTFRGVLAQVPGNTWACSVLSQPGSGLPQKSPDFTPTAVGLCFGWF